MLLYALYCQFKTLPEPKGPFTDQVVIVTGANSGIGLEAARHYARLDAKKVILAVRNIESGNDAKKSIEESTNRADVVEVWHLDYLSLDSVKAFCHRVSKELPRLDIVALNAGIATASWRMSQDGYEEGLQVNVISTALLASLLLPKLYATADQFNVTPRLTILSSETHVQASLAKIPQDQQIIEFLNKEEHYTIGDYYSISKLLEILYFQQVVKYIPEREPGRPKVIMNIVDPGLCYSNLLRERPNPLYPYVKKILARTPEVGGATIVNAGENNNFETHGKYLMSCMVYP
jgi:retinol dehydrogenase-12